MFDKGKLCRSDVSHCLASHVKEFGRHVIHLSTMSHGIAQTRILCIIPNVSLFKYLLTNQQLWPFWPASYPCPLLLLSPPLSSLLIWTSLLLGSISWLPPLFWAPLHSARVAFPTALILLHCNGVFVPPLGCGSVRTGNMYVLLIFYAWHGGWFLTAILSILLS